jgi:hypothetical protein
MPLPTLGPLNALQKVVIARLKADATLTALLGSATRVVDYVPETMTPPYVRVGEFTSTAAGSHTSIGRNVVMTIHVWTKVRGNKDGQTIANRITELLDRQTAALSTLLEVEGHRVITIRAEFDQSLTDPDPEIRHHVLRFRVETAQLS